MWRIKNLGSPAYLRIEIYTTKATTIWTLFASVASDWKGMPNCCFNYKEHKEAHTKSRQSDSFIATKHAASAVYNLNIKDLITRSTDDH